MSDINTLRKLVTKYPEWLDLPVMLLNTNGDLKSIIACSVFDSEDERGNKVLVIDPT